MKHLAFTPFCLSLALAFSPQAARSQCIEDIFYFEQDTMPCFFAGTVASADPECLDLFALPPWQHTWTISDPAADTVMATYEGLAFAHQFELFGGYEFCLQISKDGELSKPECATYTTCQACTAADVSFKYLSCPTGEGCELLVSASLPAVNAVGVRDIADIVASYQPTPQELLGGDLPFDLVFPNIPVEHHPDSGRINVSDKITVPYRRGCWRAKIILHLEEGAGAHSSWGGPPCTEVVLEDDEVFRCLACDVPDCSPSIYASLLSNETGRCEAMPCQVDDERAAGSRGGQPDGQRGEPQLLVSPNPASHAFHLDFLNLETEGGLRLRLFDAVGRLVREELVLEKNLRHLDLNVAELPAGAYWLAVQEGGKTVAARRVAILK